MSGCYKYLEMMQRELDGELSEIEKKMLEKHMEQCPFCREEYAAFRTVADMFAGVEMMEPPRNLSDLIMAEVMELEPGTEDLPREIPIVHNLKGIGLLVALASINAALFGSWLVSLVNVRFDALQLQLLCRILTDAFTHFEIVGRHTGQALQTVITSIARALPWGWIELYGTLLIVIVGGTWILHRKGGDEA